MLSWKGVTHYLAQNIPTCCKHICSKCWVPPPPLPNTRAQLFLPTLLKNGARAAQT